MKVYRLGFILILCVSSTAWAKDKECNKKVGTLSVCEVAKKLSESMSKQLPLKASDQVSLESATSDKNVVSVIGKFNFDETVANAYFTQNEINLEQFQNTYSEKIKPKLCKPGSETQIFITSGGVISYFYKYKNDKPFMKFGVSNCN